MSTFSLQISEGGDAGLRDPHRSETWSAVWETGPVQRVSVVGVSGSGKSRLAASVAEAIDAPHVELDALFHQPGWQPCEPDIFIADVRAATSGERWVVDGNYRIAVRDGPVWERADTVVWLDLPRSVTIRQSIRRTFGRAIRRTELWNGNRESPVNMLRWDPHKSIIRWSWTSYDRVRSQYIAAMTDPRFDHLRFIRLTSHTDAERWLASVDVQT